MCARWCIYSRVFTRVLYFDLQQPKVEAMSGEEVKSGEGGGGGGERVRSEDELGLKWDRCVADTIIKTGERERDSERERAIEKERGDRLRREREKRKKTCV